MRGVTELSLLALIAVGIGLWLTHRFGRFSVFFLGLTIGFVLYGIEVSNRQPADNTGTLFLVAVSLLSAYCAVSSFKKEQLERRKKKRNKLNPFNRR